MRGLGCLAAAALVLLGCAPSRIPILRSNLPPVVEFTDAPVAADRSSPYFYVYDVYWSGFDSDGRVDHFEYAVDPGTTDTVWVRTARNHEVMVFSAGEPDSLRGPVPKSSQFHILVLRAVDNEGALSARRTRAFYSYTIAPTVAVRDPRPSHLLSQPVVPSVTIHWDGHDADGQRTQRPVYYRHHLFSLDDPANRYMLSNPDSLRRREAAARFAAWDSTGSDTMSVHFTNLRPGGQYLFAIVAFDEAGAYSPVFSLDENMVQLRVELASVIGPRLHVFNELVDFTYESGGYTTDPLRWINIEAAEGRDLSVNWDAIASQGAIITAYRWALDLSDLGDGTPRTDEDADVRHWSRPGALTTSCTLKGLTHGTHTLYIEARDNNGLAALAVVKITVVALTFERDLLVVDDTRLEPDKPVAGGCMDLYKSPWPSATELDTFLFARGHVPWRCLRNGVARESDPGVLAGYSYDTLGTRQGLEVPTNAVLLSRLGRYRNVLWLVDGIASTYRDVFGPFPTTALRYMSAPGRPTTLGAYVAAGGRVWLCGGGAATASLDEFNNTANDDAYGRVYAQAGRELGPGRPLFDGAHWRSGITSTTGAVHIVRAARADSIAAHPWRHPDRWGDGEIGSPDYRRLPAQLTWRDPALDPLPPTRTASQGLLYYRGGFAIEYLSEANSMIEDVDPDLDKVREQAVLDTLFEVRSPTLRGPVAPVMTWYHGREANRCVFSGFAPWDFRRDDAIALVDFVLQDLWGLRRAPVLRSSGTAPATPERQPRGGRVVARGR